MSTVDLQRVSMSLKHNVAIIGAGLMGHGIAHVMAQAGHTVRVFDRSADALASLSARLESIANLMSTDGQAANRVTSHHDIADAVANADFVIEAAVENLEMKQFIVAELEASVAPETIIATNTSALPINKISEKAFRPERIVGTHFWNPPHLVKLVEVVQSDKTSDETITKTMEFMSGVGHRAVHVKKDIPGFIGNRLQHALKREAIALVANGVCDAKTVDDVVKHGFGKRLAVLGPLEQSDLVGLNLTKAIHDSLMPDIDITQTAHPHLEELIAAGHLGMSTGQGFYNWTEESATALRDRLSDFLINSAKDQGGKS